MVEPVDVEVFFNFRSPYCYLASKHLFSVFDEFHARLVWRPLGGWDGRSPPDRAARKIPLVRQDVARFCRRMGIPFNPPPPGAEPTLAALGSLLAERRGLLAKYTWAVMDAEWGRGQDIGARGVLLDIATACGLDPVEFERMLDDQAAQAGLAANWQRAEQAQVFGVPSFVVGDQIFWGQDRLDFLRDHLRELRLAKL